MNEIQVEGLNKLLRELKSIDPALNKKIQALNKRLASDVAGDAKNLVPVDSGTLKASIRAGASQRSGNVKAGKATVKYAGPVHFGWRKRNIEPQPFLYDALDNRREEVLEAYLREVQAVVNSV